MNSGIEIHFHTEVDEVYAEELVIEFGTELVECLAVQASSGRLPQVVMTHDTDHESFVIYACSHEVALSQGLAGPNGAAASCHAVVMPRRSDLAQEIIDSLVNSPDTRTFYPAEACLGVRNRSELN